MPNRSEMTFERVSENLPVYAMARAAGIEATRKYGDNSRLAAAGVSHHD